MAAWVFIDSRNMFPMIPTMRIKFTAYKIRMAEGLFEFFEFEDLSFEFCGGFVAIGRRKYDSGHFLMA